MRGCFVVALAVAACGSHHGTKDSGTGGACTTDNQCNGMRCCSSVCVETSDCAFAVTQVAPASGFVNGGDWLTLTGAGFAMGMQVFIGVGRAPVRVVL